ncbi:hypothetical protein WOLCODRAFT_91296 [Wolfiporia cocos MD-104 SS10]|uniref:Rhodanese domain-containing protein n=1 Tax=Wolfiporia cocos (strain MD-104) TaxID=742152 RepID=A0A2H3IXW3_WOLCO|nr:hypothetical protein WOLCODRAFT_91296 [Wolfiporia cocos MD-104 SS10]
MSSTGSKTTSYGELTDSGPNRMSAPASETRRWVSEPPRRTLDDVRQQAAQSVAIQAIQEAEDVDGSKVGVVITLSRSSGERFLKLIAESISQVLQSKRFLFAVAAPSAVPQEPCPFLFCGSSETFVERAGLLINSKFLSRIIDSVHISRGMWVGSARGLTETSYDELAFWDVVRKSVRNDIDPLVPPPGSRSVQQLLIAARARLERVTPQRAYAELHDTTTPWPIILVDIRPEFQRRVEGIIQGALIVERNMLEWRFDPRCTERYALADRYDLRILVIDQDGTTSSLAAASLHDLGMLNATDIIGGYVGWREIGLPSQIGPSVPQLARG